MFVVLNGSQEESHHVRGPPKNNTPDLEIHQTGHKDTSKLGTMFLPRTSWTKRGQDLLKRPKRARSKSISKGSTNESHNSEQLRYSKGEACPMSHVIPFTPAIPSPDLQMHPINKAISPKHSDPQRYFKNRPIPKQF